MWHQVVYIYSPLKSNNQIRLDLTQEATTLKVRPCVACWPHKRQWFKYVYIFLSNLLYLVNISYCFIFCYCWCHETLCSLTYVKPTLIKCYSYNIFESRVDLHLKVNPTLVCKVNVVSLSLLNTQKYHFICLYHLSKPFSLTKHIMSS